MAAVHPIPAGYSSITPYLIIKGAAAALEFYRKVFGAEQTLRLDGPDGRVGHAEIRIGTSNIMLADEPPQSPDTRSPESLGGTPVGIMLYIADVDSIVDLALAAGATLIRPVKDQFYGDRLGSIRDPFGHIWHIATHIEDLAPEELARRAAEAGKGA